MTSVEFGCSGCGRAVEACPGETATCARCGAPSTLEDPGVDALGECLACGCPELYRHRDFNQKLGLLVIGAGVALSLGLSTFVPLVAAAAVDLLLYLVLPDVAICYRCKAHHRGFRNIRAIRSFDLERHEHYRFKRAREEKD